MIEVRLASATRRTAKTPAGRTRNQTRVPGGSNKRDGMCDGERGDDGNERAKAAKGDHQAKQEEQMVGAIENVEKTKVHETHSRLVPSRIETDKAGIADEFERANTAAGWQKPQNGDHPQTQASKRWVNGKAGLF